MPQPKLTKPLPDESEHPNWHKYDIALRLSTLKSNAKNGLLSDDDRLGILKTLDSLRDQLRPFKLGEFLPMIALVEQQRVEVRVFLRKMRYTGDLGIMGGRILAK